MIKNPKNGINIIKNMKNGKQENKHFMKVRNIKKKLSLEI